MGTLVYTLYIPDLTDSSKIKWHYIEQIIQFIEIVKFAVTKNWNIYNESACNLPIWFQENIQSMHISKTFT